MSTNDTDQSKPDASFQNDKHGLNSLDSAGAGLTKFQLRTLAIVANKPRYGLAVKRELESYYGESVNHGRLYPNLDDLVDKGLVEKGQLDKRTNEYAATELGHSVLASEIAWLSARQRDPNPEDN